MTGNWEAYWRLMRFDRPIGILLLLWPTWWALLWAGNGRPSAANMAIFTAGVIVMRAAGCVMNDIADRKIDPHVARTRARPLAAGELQTRDALITFGILLTIAFVLVLQTNLLTVMLAFAGAALAATYPFFKRFTDWPQVILGMAFGWGIPMAFAAETGQVPIAAWVLFAVNIIWAIIYDTLYAMVDREDDLKIGVKSTAILFGSHDRWILGVLMVAMIAVLVGLGSWQALTWPWFAGLAAAALLFARQQWMIHKREGAACFAAFLNNNWVGLMILLGAAGHFLLAG